MINKRGPQGLILLAKRSLAPVFWMPLLSFATLGILLVHSGKQASADDLPIPSQTNITQSKTVTSESIQAQPTPQATAPPTMSTPKSPARQVAAVVSSMYCRVASFGAPSPILAESSAIGVTVVTDSPVYYTFRGSSTNSNTIAQATSCARQQPALGGKYHGLTARTIKYAYGITPIDDTTCRVDAVKVTLHQTVLLPQADMASLPAAAASQWQATAAKLQSHEYEHVGINRTYVQRIYDQLTGFTSPCANLNSEASGVAEQNIANMNAANRALDASTNHGTL